MKGRSRRLIFTSINNYYLQKMTTLNRYKNSSALIAQRDWGAQYDTLFKQHQRLKDKHDETLNELKQFKTKSQNLERELSKTRNTLEAQALNRIVEQKFDLEQKFNQSKEVLRKIQMKGRIKVPVSNQEQGSKLEDLHEQIDKLNDHVLVLSRALELKVEEFGLEGDLRSALLYDVGFCREELHKAKMHEKRMLDDFEILQLELDEAKVLIEELKLVRESDNQELNKLEGDIHKLRTENKKLQERVDELHQERLSLLEYIDEINQEQRQDKENYESVISNLSHKDSRLQTNTEDLRNAILEKEVIIDEMRLKYEQAHETIKELDTEVGELQRQLDEVRQENQQLIKKTARQVETVQQKDAEIDNINQAFQTLQREIVSQRKYYQHLETEKQNAEHQLMQLRKSINDSQESQSQAQEYMKEKLEKALTDLEDLIEERDQLKEAMNEAINKNAASYMTQQNLEKEKGKLTHQIENLVTSKSLLQRTLTEQINALKSQLDRVMEEKAILLDENGKYVAELRKVGYRI